jgi:hypothetical protein
MKPRSAVAVMLMAMPFATAFSHVSLGIRYVAGSPEYDVTATGTGGTVQGKVKQSTACVLISGGVAF